MLPAVTTSILAWVLAGAPAGADDAPRACSPAGSVTIVKNRFARVYGRSRGHQLRIFGCLYSSGRVTGLTVVNTQRERTPMFALARSFVAYGVYLRCFGDCEPDDFGPVIAVDDLLPGRFVDLVHLQGRDDAELGSLVVNQRGGVAWIECNGPCSRRGASRAIYRRNGSRERSVSSQVGDVELLGRGRAIDPTSLRRRGERLVWRDNGRRESARLR